METVRIDILNPKAGLLLKNLADLELIKIKKEKQSLELTELLQQFRSSSDSVPTFDEITAEVETVRKTRYEN